MKRTVHRIAVKLDSFLGPPPEWRFVVIVLTAALFGLGLSMFHLSNASSYLSDDPSTCVNCHVMYPQYATWQRGSHGRFATCNDCHVPQDNPVRSYLFKAQDGMRHAYVFTFRLEPQVIQIKQAGKEVVQENCIRCHEHLVSLARLGTQTYVETQHGEGKACWECHRDVPHGRVNSLASTPYARVPRLTPAIATWITDMSSTAQ